jgi:hypothetical protein
VPVVSIVHIRYPGKPGGQTVPDRLLANIAVSPGSFTTRHEKDTVLSEIAHNFIQIVPIEGVEKAFKRVLCNHG